MKKLNFILSIFLFISIHSFAYIPPIINSALINQKGEFQAAFTYGTAGAEQFFSYGADEDLYVYLSSSFTFDTVYTENEGKRKHMFFEGGFGYSSTSANGHWIFAMGGSYGYGQFFNKYYNVTGTFLTEPYNNNIYLTANTHKFSIQTDIGLKKPSFEFIFNNRFAVGYFASADHRYKIQNSTISFFEPGVTLKAGPGKVKFMAQFRFGIPLNSTYYDMSYSALSIGIILHLKPSNSKKPSTTNTDTNS